MKPRRALFLLSLAALPLLVYLPVLDHELIWDAKPMILENDLLQKEFSPLAPFRSGYWASTSQRPGGGYDYYRPLTVLSYMTEKAVWGLAPFRLRLTNLMIFIAALFFLYLFFIRQTGAPGVAEIAVLLYALFPLHLDNITWVVGRCDLLMLLFGTFALLLFDHFLEKRTPWPGLLALGCYALALFSKEASLFFLPLFPLHELMRRRRLSLPIYIFPLLVTAGFWLIKSTVIGRSGVPIHLFPSIWENGRILLGALGYYLRPLVFPYRYELFLPVEAVQTMPYILPGLLFAIILLLLPWLGRKKPHYLHAWLWIAPFLAGHLFMVFTPVYPYSITTRYLLIPAIGLTWLLSHWLNSLPGGKKKIILAMLLIASAAAIIRNSQKYQNETTFLASAFRSYPNDSFILSKYAGQLAENGDFIRAEIYLRRALSFKMKNSTAIFTALQLADVAFAKARYEESLGWLEKMRLLPLDLLQTKHRLLRLLKIHRARGDLARSEATLSEMAGTFPAERMNPLRLELYVAFAEWEKARRTTQAFAAPQAEAWSEAIHKEENTFRSLSPDQRALFFIRHGNFALAWDLWPDKDPRGIPEQLQTARLAILAGNEEEGKRRIERLIKKHEADFKVLNSAGNLFFDLQRADEALFLYQRSLRQNPGQPALRQRVAWIQQLQELVPLP